MKVLGDVPPTRVSFFVLLVWPDIDWKICVIQSHQYTKEINEEFLSFLDDNSLQQMVATPTRKTNILDLFLTNRPSLLNRCEVIPGISDHEAVFVNMNIEPHRSKPTKRKILLWKKARGTSLIGKIVRDFFRTKGFIRIFDGFFLKTKGFLPKVYEIFGSEMPLGKKLILML